MEKQIIEYAKECLQCKNPQCMKGCPAMVDIPKMMHYIVENQFERALDGVLERDILPFVCGYLCDQAKQCEGHCIKAKKSRAVQIGKVEAALGELFLNRPKEQPVTALNDQIAIIGGGAAGMTAAYLLAQQGFSVTIFERFTQLGGVIAQTLPNFRYDAHLLDTFIEKLLALGVTIKTGCIWGENLFIDQLTEYRDIILTMGASSSNVFLKPGNGIYQGLSVLAHAKQGATLFQGKSVLVIGGGNVALDVARTVKRMNNHVMIAYRRDFANAPAAKAEIEHALKEGIEFLEKIAPVQPIYHQNILVGCRFEKTNLIDNKASRLSFVGTGEDLEQAADVIIEAIGATPEYTYLQQVYPTIFNQQGWITANDSFQTEIPHVYVGGDFFTGPKTFVGAMAAGRDIALQIIKHRN